MAKELVKLSEQEILENKRVELGRQFEPFLLNKDMEGAMELFDKIRTEIDAKLYHVGGDAFKSLSILVKDHFQKIEKPITVVNTFIGLNDLIETEGIDSVELNSTQLEFIGEMYSKIGFTTVEEARVLAEIQESFKDLYTPMMRDKMEARFAAEFAQKVEQAAKLGDLEQEEVNINEVEEK